MSAKKRPASQQKVDRLRERIDKIDQRILTELSKRGRCVQEIGEIKASSDATFHAPARERSLLEQLVEHNEGPYSDEAIETIYREIMSASLALESPLNIAYCSSISRKAIRHRFGRSARTQQEKTAADALEALAGGWVHYAVVDIEDDSDGFHGPTVDALCDSGAPITGEIVMEDSKKRTRLLIAGGDTPDPTARDRTSVVFIVRNEPGGLLRVLRELGDRGANLTCIESRPLRGSPWQYRFFVDIDGHRNQPPIAEALRALEDGGTVYHVLGSYPRGD